MNTILEAFSKAQPHIIKNPARATIEADLQRPEARLKYLLLFTPRSGSTLLISMLRQTQMLGIPDEYFNARTLEYRLAGPSPCQSAQEYLRLIMRTECTPNGVFGMKLSWFQFLHLSEITNTIDALGPNARFLHLTRMDLLAQAISLHFAIKRDSWHSIEADFDNRNRTPVGYSSPEIWKQIYQILQAEFEFQKLFRKANIQPLLLRYEEIVTSPNLVMSRIAAFVLGKPAELGYIDINSLPLKRLGSKLNEDHKIRFYSKFRNQVEFLLRYRGRLSASAIAKELSFPELTADDAEAGSASKAQVFAGNLTQTVFDTPQAWTVEATAPSAGPEIPVGISGKKPQAGRSFFEAGFHLLRRMARRALYYRYRGLVANSQLFDGDFYLSQYPDVKTSGIDPLFHYFMHGAAEGRQPSAGFDPIYYVGTYPDVARPACNPLLHYLLLGKAQGLLPLKAQPPAHEPEVISSTPPETASAPLPGTPRDEWPEADCSALVSLLSSRSFVVVLSHDDYTSQTGGVQLYLSDEEEAFTKAGIAYLQLFPFPRPPKASATDGWSEVVGIHVDGRKFGKTSAASLLAGLEKIRGANPEGCRSMIVHHLLGWSIDWVTKAHSALGSAPAYYWMHDHFAVCRQYTLMRNSVRFCGAPAPETHACEICAYGGARRTKHLASMKTFFQALTPTVVFPSGTPRKFWSSTFGDLPLRLLEIPHLEKVANGSEPAADRTSNSSRLRIGYLGAEHSMIKGWGTWRFLVDRCEALDGKYEFLRLGTGTAHGHETHVPVAATKHNRDAMVAALKDQKIDLVLLWSLCPETFSFTLHESLAAGCFVVTYVNSGNIRHTVETEGCGKVFSSEEDLVEWLSDEDAVRKEIEAVRARSGGASVFRRRLFAAEELLQETKSP